MISSFCKKCWHPCNWNFHLSFTCKNDPRPYRLNYLLIKVIHGIELPQGDFVLFQSKAVDMQSKVANFPTSTDSRGCHTLPHPLMPQSWFEARESKRGKSFRKKKRGNQLFKLNLGIEKDKNGYSERQTSIVFFENVPVAANSAASLEYVLHTMVNWC